MMTSAATCEGEHDQSLVTAASQGNRSAFAALVVRHQRRAFSLAQSRLRSADEAKDVCQEAFLRAYSNLSSFRGGAEFFTWIHRIITNLCIDQQRRRRVRLEVELDEGRASDDDSVSPGHAPQRLAPSPAEALARKELRHHLVGALAQLSAPHREVLTLREIDGLSYEEIADTMCCPVGTVMSRLFHARRHMQRLLRPVAC